MTLPEIPKEEEKEQPKTKCQFCGKEGASKSHERFCSKNPNNPRTKKKMAMKQEGSFSTPPTESKTPAEPITSPLAISEVQSYIGNDVAWFEGQEGKFFLEPNYIGIVDNIPHVLVQFHDGAIIPPSSIPGFIGMFKEDAQFESKQNDDEPFPPFPEEVEEEKQTEIKAHLLDEKISFDPEFKPITQTTQTKKSWWPFSHSKKVKANTPTPDRTELTTLVEGAIDATG